MCLRAFFCVFLLCGVQVDAQCYDDAVAQYDALHALHTITLATLAEEQRRRAHTQATARSGVQMGWWTGAGCNEVWLWLWLLLWMWLRLRL